MNYKKIIPTVMALGVFAFAGLGCTKDPQKEPIEVKEYNSILNQTKGNRELRQQVHKYLDESYTLDTDKHEITVSTYSTVFAWYQSDNLVVRIKNKSTKDVLKLYDYSVDGDVDVAEYNGVPNGLEGMDERFDKALELVKPKLEQKVKKDKEKEQLLINRVRENTKLD